MRLGTNLPGDESVHTNGQYDLDKSIDALANAGIRGCLTNFTGDESRWESSSRTLERALNRAGVALLEYNTPFLIHVPTKDACRAVTEKVVRLLAIAESVGCLNVVTCIQGPTGLVYHPWNWSAEAWDLLRETCALIAEDAARQGLKARLLLELVYVSTVRSPEALARIVDEAASPNIQGHMDIANCYNFDALPHQAPFIQNAFQVLGNRIQSAHIKDVAPLASYFPGVRELFVGEGCMDFRTYLECLAKMPPDFPVVIEHMHAMADIERSYRRICGIAGELNIPVWDE